MFENARQKEIFEIVRKEGSATVEYLASHFGVSKMTIRRDLEKMQEMDILHRTHGGVMLPQMLFKEMTYLEKQTQNIELKHELANEALQYVGENNVVFLDAGTTTFELAKLLLDRQDLIVVTNDLRIARQLANAGNRVYIPGGMVSTDTASIYSLEAVDYFKKMNIDVAFLAASSVDSNMNVCTPNEEKVWIKRHMVESTARTVLVVDHSKFNKKAVHKIFNLEEVDHVVTNYNYEIEEE